MNQQRQERTATYCKHRPTGYAKQITAQQEPGQPGSRGSTPVDLMVGEKKAISRGFFRYNGPCECQDGHCAVRKSVIYIYSIYIYAPPSNRPLEHLFVVQPSYARPTHAIVRIGVWYHPHGACSGFWLSIFGTRLFWPSLQCAPKPMKLVHRCHLCGWFRG